MGVRHLDDLRQFRVISRYRGKQNSRGSRTDGCRIFPWVDVAHAGAAGGVRQADLDQARARRPRSVVISAAMRAGDDDIPPIPGAGQGVHPGDVVPGKAGRSCQQDPRGRPGGGKARFRACCLGNARTCMRVQLHHVDGCRFCRCHRVQNAGRQGRAGKPCQRPGCIDDLPRYAHVDVRPGVPSARCWVCAIAARSRAPCRNLGAGFDVSPVPQ